MPATLRPVLAPYIEPVGHATQTVPWGVVATFFVAFGAAECLGAAPAAGTNPGAPPAKIMRYAQRLLDRYDRNRDGRLQEVEWRQMPGEPQRADVNRDGLITSEELAQMLAAYAAQHRLHLDSLLPTPEPNPTASTEPAVAEPAVGAPAASPAPDAPPAGTPAPMGLPTRRDAKFHLSTKRLPPGLPDWFLRRDLDGDGQLILSEFAPQTTAADRREFARYDLNSDGVVTPQEYLKVTRPPKATSAHAPPAGTRPD